MDKRVAFRFPTDLEAECRSCKRSWTSRLCNISTTGCMITLPETGLPEGALLRVRIKGLTAIDGAIIWQHRDHAGVRFNAPLHSAVLEHLAFRTPRDELEGSSESAPRAAATGLHGQLVKRSWHSDDGPMAEPVQHIARTG